MKRKQIKKTKTRLSDAPPVRKEIPNTDNTLKKWMNGFSENVLTKYALPLARFTEDKIRDLKLKLESSSHP